MKDVNIKTEKQLLSFLNRYNKYVLKEKDLNSCFKWIGAKTSNGYPVLSMGRKLGPVRVSRLLLNLKTNIPFENACVLHSCDNPECTNVLHLSWGTHKENMLDCVNKNRNHKLKGLSRDFSPRCNIKTKDIYEIKILSVTKNAKEISEIYKVNEETVRRLLKKENIQCVDKRLSKNKNL